MKTKLAGILLGAALIAQANVASYAEVGAYDAVVFPFRLVTSAAAGSVGLVYGGVRGVVETEKKVFDDEEAVDGNVFMWPVSIAKGALAVPFGFVTGMPKGLAEGVTAGWEVWDRNE